MLLEQGVIEFNKKQIEVTNTMIKGVDQVFLNLKQFYK